MYRNLICNFDKCKCCSCLKIYLLLYLSNFFLASSCEPEGVLVKTEKADNVVLDMPLLASPDSSKLLGKKSVLNIQFGF